MFATSSLVFIHTSTCVFFTCRLNAMRSESECVCVVLQPSAKPIFQHFSYIGGVYVFREALYRSHVHTQAARSHVFAAREGCEGGRLSLGGCIAHTHTHFGRSPMCCLTRRKSPNHCHSGRSRGDLIQLGFFWPTV
jgi:hypothetical protein